MNKSSLTLKGFKYFYLVIFFALLSGFFHPLVTGQSSDNVIMGVLVLFLGLTGGVLVYKGVGTQKRRSVLIIGGFGLIVLSLFFIYQLSGRI